MTGVQTCALPICILQHDHAVAETDRKRATAATFAYPHDDDRHAHRGKQCERLGDGERLTALLGFDAGVSAGGVEEGHDGQPELIGQAHDTHRLAVALGVG